MRPKLRLTQTADLARLANQPLLGRELAEAAAAACSVVDRGLEAVVVDGGVDRRGADVRVAGELADDVDRYAGVGKERQLAKSDDELGLEYVLGLHRL